MGGWSLRRRYTSARALRNLANHCRAFLTRAR